MFTEWSNKAANDDSRNERHRLNTATMKPATLKGLPDELFCQVVEHVDNQSCDRLMLVCNDFWHHFKTCCECKKRLEQIRAQWRATPGTIAYEMAQI